MVDWSAGRPPRRGANSIWVATTDVRSRAEPAVENPPTPALALAAIDRAVDAAAGPVLVGIDACLGFPAGFAARVAPDGGRRQDGTAPRRSTPWRALWEELAELVDEDTANRWEVAATLNHRVTGDATSGPFWGHVLGARRPVFPVAALAEWRTVELALRAAGRRPTSPWQAAYAGAVGLQSITAVALLERWRRRRRDVAVWPFERPTVRTRAVVAEVYPSMHPELPGHPVRDARQVAGTALALTAMARAGRLAPWWSRRVLRTLPPAATIEEGWTLGVEPVSP
jgi:hypothetical protein